MDELLPTSAAADHDAAVRDMDATCDTNANSINAAPAGSDAREKHHADVPVIVFEGVPISVPSAFADLTWNDPSAIARKRHIPNFGDAVLFLLLAAFLIFLIEAIAGAIALSLHLLPHDSLTQMAHEAKLIVPSMAFAYLFTLAGASLVFLWLWKRPFLIGIRWNAAAAARLNWRLPAIGIAVGLVVQLMQNYLPMPKTVPMDDYFKTRSDIWIVTAFGILFAPAFEEIAFRGMFLPAIANAWDWFGRIAKPQEPHLQPLSVNTDLQATTSRSGLIFSTILTSIVFAMLHADQLGHAISPLILLFSVSLVLTFVRLRTGSVAASTLVHASYNFSVFLTMFIGTDGYRHLERLKH